MLAGPCGKEFAAPKPMPLSSLIPGSSHFVFVLQKSRHPDVRPYFAEGPHWLATNGGKESR